MRDADLVHTINQLYGSAMSPIEIAHTIPLETIELLLIWKDR